MSQVKRPTRVVMVDADDPLEEVRGEFFWREDHERAVEAARDEAYRAGYQDGLAADPRPRRTATLRVRVVRRTGLLRRAVVLLVAAAFLASLVGNLLR